MLISGRETYHMNKMNAELTAHFYINNQFYDYYVMKL